MELNNFAVNKDLLVREALFLTIEQFDGVLHGLFLFILVHNTKIISLRVELHLETDRVVESLNGSLAGGNFDEANTRVLIFTRDGGIHEHVSIGSPHQTFNSVNSDRFLHSI